MQSLKVFKSNDSQQFYIEGVTFGSVEDFSYTRNGDFFDIDRINTKILEVRRLSFDRFADESGNGFIDADAFEAYLISQLQVDPIATASNLSEVATSNDYNDLDNLPSIPLPAPVDSVNGQTGAVVVGAADLGLENVDNTSDIDKPISTAVQNALDGKVNDSQVLTDVPAGAVFTDTVYDDTDVRSDVTDLQTDKANSDDLGAVAFSNSYNDLDDLPVVVDGQDGADGQDGLSAFEIAVNNGFVGTEAQWLDSLVGADGQNGSDGAAGNDGADGIDGLNGQDGADGNTVITQSETFEESAALSDSTSSGFQWGVGNGDEIVQNGGIASLIDGSIQEIALHIFQGSATVELYLNGVATGQTIAASGTNATANVTVNVPVTKGDRINFRTIAASGNVDGGQVGFLSTTGAIVTPINLNAISDVDVSGATNGQVLTWDGTNWVASTVSGGGGTDVDTVQAIAAGSTLGLQQELLANAGQPGLTVLAVGQTTSGKVQGVSLGDGNVIEVYSNGADFNSGTVLYREFMSLGEPICFTGLSNGAIITSTQGFYGFSENVSGNNESPMPLLSYGLSFKSTFLFGFRDSTTGEGKVWVVNGPLDNSITLTDGSGVVQLGQENIALTPWQFIELDLNGNIEYILSGTNNMMACIGANMDVPQFYDLRLVMPLTNDGITWPRSGFVSAPFDNTVCLYYVRDNAEGTFTVSPGTPVDFEGATGATDRDYEPNGATRVLATGLISAYSGADSAGLEASPLMPTSAMSQVVAQPLTIADNGDGGNSGVAIASPYEGTALVYEWNTTTSSLDLAYTVPLTRSGVTVLDKVDQRHPAAGLISNDAEASNTLVGQLNPGVIIADVPITVIVQNGTPTLVPTIRSQNGTTTTGIVTDDDETLSLGITPNNIAVEIREGTDEILYKRVIGAGGTESWVQA